MQRALNSCLLTFGPVISRGKRIIALPGLTDAGTHESGSGSSERVLTAAFGDNVGLGLLPAGWDRLDPEGEFGCSSEWLEHRATVVRILLWGRAATLPSDAQVVVMTHGFATEPKDDVRLVETWESHLRQSLPTTSTLTDDERKMLREGATRRISGACPRSTPRFRWLLKRRLVSECPDSGG
ncbi:hypothetical protein DL769_000648 [Monosporascus sp. CRB-8-3]|nr:hypothetical protein DL769_000648 [Monosporascus sp. CRB-8-3]